MVKTNKTRKKNKKKIKKEYLKKKILLVEME